MDSLTIKVLMLLCWSLGWPTNASAEPQFRPFFPGSHHRPLYHQQKRPYHNQQRLFKHSMFDPSAHQDDFGKPYSSESQEQHGPPPEEEKGYTPEYENLVHHKHNGYQNSNKSGHLRFPKPSAPYHPHQQQPNSDEEYDNGSPHLEVIMQEAIYRGDYPVKETSNLRDHIRPNLLPTGVKGLQVNTLTFINGSLKGHDRRNHHSK